LIFNPGAGTGFKIGRETYAPSFGLLHFYPQAQVVGEIIPLDSIELRSGVWITKD
jgi:hypothetical protein